MSFAPRSFFITMSTETEKRPTDEGSVGTKRVKYDNGIAPIKPEFIVESASGPVDDRYVNDDDAEAGDRTMEEDKGKKKKKKRGQNKKRDMRQQHEDLRLCSSMVDPGNPGHCKFGPEHCRSTHDISAYLAAKAPDIAGVCPVFKAIGYCPAGLKCRWLGSHYADEKVVRDDARIAAHAASGLSEVNKISTDAKVALQKKKYVFDISDKVIAFLDLQVQSDENIAKQEENKEKYAAYVEQPFKIAEKKKLDLRRAKIVSPLTTVGNLPYRRLMKVLGADVTYSEMALSVPLLQATNSEWALPKAHSTEYPGFGVQIATSKHWAAAKAAEVIYKETSHVSELNLNCGCPIDLLYRQGQGSALMEQPARLLRILKGMNASSGDIPVTVKIRTGTKDNKNTAKSLVERVLAENDVAAVTLHGRSRQQRYTKDADWDYIKEVGAVVTEWNNKKEDDKESSESQRTNFVGNGDVFTHEDWYNAVNSEGVDSVMVARGALIKPWIFEEVDSQQYLDKSATERLEILRQFANFSLEHWGSDEYGVGLSRRFMCEFLSFTHRYIPVGILERLPPRINQRPPQWRGRNELETLLGSTDYKDWIKITEMFYGKAGENFAFIPKHKSNAHESG